MKTIKFQTCILAFLAAILCPEPACQAEQPFPKGVMLNLDFQNIQDGLIPSKTLYPLYVPLGNLSTKIVKNREILILREGQGLDIPHSSLLDPNGGDWVATIRFFLQSDGIILSQGNDQEGYVIYTKEGVLQVAIRTAASTVILQESKKSGATRCLGKWITIDLQIKQGMAILNLNRARVGTTPLASPLNGKGCKIRIGEHQNLPAPLQGNTTLSPSGFTGAISSLKILRQ